MSNKELGSQHEQQCILLELLAMTVDLLDRVAILSENEDLLQV